MSAIKEINDKFETLRRQAQQLIEKEPKNPPKPPYDIYELIQELRIHQVELEMQNEELRQTQKELIELHLAYENLYERAPCGYLTINHQGIITRVNLTGVNFFKKSRKTLINSNLSQFIADGWRDSYLAALSKSGRTGSKESVELRLKSEKNTPCWVRADLEAERNISGSVIQWRVILIDISAQKLAEEKARRLEEQLRQTQKMESIGTLAGGIAHEFNNMLTIIMGNADVIEEYMPPEDYTRESIREIQTAVLRAKEVVRQLLTFSRKNGVKDSPLAIGPVVKEAMQLVRASTPTNIDIRFSLPDELPLIWGNATQINQLLINLCGNAADAVQPMGGLIFVDVSQESLDQNHLEIYPELRPGRYIKITVRDNGAGMDEETRKRVFEPYFTTKKFGKGTGIGLAVVHGIVQRHKGCIGVTSEPGKGTLFTILLPVYEDGVVEKSPVCIIAPTGDERILFVDDEPSILKIKKKQLEGMGYTVLCFEDPLDALAWVKKNPDQFDLVITDMAMPCMAGDRLACEILKIAPQIPILLCTGYSERLSEKNAKEIGIAGFILKPAERDELAVKIRNVLDEAGRQKTVVEKTRS